MPTASPTSKEERARAHRLKHQKFVLSQLIDKGWNFESIARALGTRPQTVYSWFHDPGVVARPRSMRQLESLLETEPGATLQAPGLASSPRQQSGVAADAPAPTDLANPMRRALFFLTIQKRLGMTRRHLAEALEIGRRTLDNYMDERLAVTVPEEVLLKTGRLLAAAPPTLESRFERAVTRLFGQRVVSGEAGPPANLTKILACLVEKSGYSERNLRRLIPPNKPRHLSRAVVEAFEKAADALKPRRVPKQKRATRGLICL